MKRDQEMSGTAATFGNQLKMRRCATSWLDRGSRSQSFRSWELLDKATTANWDANCCHDETRPSTGWLVMDGEAWFPSLP